ncbi:MAG: hypothetical protein R2688_09055 [Fimbriimonadaceae bacterium]
MGSATVILKPASPGTGVKAGSVSPHVLEAMSTTFSRSVWEAETAPTSLNVTVKAFKELQSPEQIAKIRGKDVNELVPWLAKARKEEALNPDMFKVTLSKSMIGVIRRNRKTVNARAAKSVQSSDFLKTASHSRHDPPGQAPLDRGRSGRSNPSFDDDAETVRKQRRNRQLRKLRQRKKRGEGRSPPKPEESSFRKQQQKALPRRQPKQSPPPLRKP